MTQASWRKIQCLGLEDLYKNNDDIKQFCGKIDGLAFLPVQQVPEGMQHLQQQCPPELNDFLEYFNETYVSGTYRRIQRPALPGNNILPPVVIRHTPPQFPPNLWNVNSITLNERARTNNFLKPGTMDIFGLWVINILVFGHP